MGIWGADAPVFLRVLVLGTTLLFALPLLLVPLHQHLRRDNRHRSWLIVA